MKKTALYALTPQGARLGRQLADELDGDLFLPARLAGEFNAIPFDRLGVAVEIQFFSYPQQVFIAAAGIVVRTIAPHLTSKDRDPAVVVLDQEGQHVISLLSGHLGGANALSRDVARLTGGDAVITTATDTAGVPSIDLLAKERNLGIGNLEAVKKINMAILNGGPVQMFDPEDRLDLGGKEGSGSFFVRIRKEADWKEGTPGVWVTWRSIKPGGNQLLLHPRVLIAGIGCNRGTVRQEIKDLLHEVFRENALALESIQCITSIDAKRDEAGLLETGRELGVPLVFFSKAEIAHIEVPHPSSTVEKHMGVSSVCEATALLKAKGGRLLVPKRKSKNVTLAVALESLQ